MPTINVNGVTLAYEVFGKGPSVVWSTHGIGARGPLAYMVAGRLAANYRVLIWDRRNSGASDLAIEDAPSDQYPSSDDLHHLLQALRMSPAYLAGACAGQTVSLLTARRYPADVKGLILVATPTDDLGLLKPIQDACSLALAAVAEEKGMQAAIDHSTATWVRQITGKSRPEEHVWASKWIAEAVSMNPGNRDRLLAMDPKAFAAIMRRWASWYSSGPGNAHGVSYDYIRSITLPALVAHGFDPLHPRQAAEKLFSQLPNAEWVEYSDRYTQEEMEQAGWSWGLALPFMEEFLARLEAR